MIKGGAILTEVEEGHYIVQDWLTSRLVEDYSLDKI